MGRPPDLWKLVRRLPLLDKPDDRRVGLWAKAGIENIVVFNDEALRFTLSRSDLSVRWEGTLYGSLLAWADRTRFVMRIGKTGRSVGAWDAETGRVIWRAKGDGRPWGESVAVVTPKSDLELRALTDGRVARSTSLAEGETKALLAADDRLVRIVDDVVTAVDLNTGTEVWRSSLLDIFSGLPQGRVALRTLIPSGQGRILVRFYTNYAMLDTSSGQLLWRRAVPTRHLPVIVDDRIGFLFGGRLLVLDRTSGGTLVDAGNAAPTLWESQPCALGILMVLVDQGGFLVTVDLQECRVIGVQRQKGAQFSRCACVDGRVLASGMDGALWVFEPSQEAGERDSKRASSSRGGRPPLKSHRHK